MYRLVLVRHAKSEWPDGALDLNRTLTKRGENDCAVAAEMLRGIDFDQAIVSVAERTRSTFNLLGLENVSVEFSPDVYEASLGTLLSVITIQKSESLLLVGHSPGIPSLAWYLSRNHESQFAMNLRMKYPTLGIAILESDLPFNEWGQATAELVAFVVPRANPNSNDLD